MGKDKLILSEITGIVKKIDSNNTEIIIKTYDGNLFFIYLDETFKKDNIISFIKEGDLVFKGDIIMKVKCGYNQKDITTFELKMNL